MNNKEKEWKNNESLKSKEGAQNYLIELILTHKKEKAKRDINETALQLPGDLLSFQSSQVYQDVEDDLWNNSMLDIKFDNFTFAMTHSTVWVTVYASTFSIEESKIVFGDFWMNIRSLFIEGSDHLKLGQYIGTQFDHLLDLFDQDKEYKKEMEKIGGVEKALTYFVW